MLKSQVKYRSILLGIFMLIYFGVSATNTIAVDSLRLKAEVAYHIGANDTLACKYIEQAMRLYEDSGNTKGTEYAKLLLLWSQYGCDEFRDDAILKGEKALKIFKESGQHCESAECCSSLAYCYSLTDDSLNLNSKKSVEYCLEALGRFYNFNLSLASSQNLIKATANVILFSQI